MNEAAAANLGSVLARILNRPAPDDLWRLQTDLLTIGGDRARKVREVAGKFYCCLLDLQSKIASRSASRWAAVLETASVTSVGLQEMAAAPENPLRRMLASGVTAMLEIAAAAKNVQAWEVEASLAYYEVAWWLAGELWEILETTRPELSPEERHGQIDQLLRPVLAKEAPEEVKAALLINLFQVVLAARIWPLLAGAPPAKPAARARK